MSQQFSQYPASLRKGLVTIFNNELETFPEVANLIQPLMTVVNTTTSREYLGWLGAVPTPSEFKGERKFTEMEMYDYYVDVKDWNIPLQIPMNDYNDDQNNLWGRRLGGLLRQASTMDVIRFTELLNNGEVGLAFDKKPFFSLIHAWKEYSTPQPNIVAGSGIASSTAIKTDLYNAYEQYADFKNSKGQYINSTDIPSWVIIAPTGTKSVIDEALMADQIGNTTNIVKNFAKVIYLQGMTGDSWYLFDTSTENKPFIKLNRERPRLITADRDTDENVKNKKMYQYIVDWRMEVAYGLWHKAIKIKN